MPCVHQEAEPSKYGTRSEVGGQEGDFGADGEDKDGDGDEDGDEDGVGVGADCRDAKGR